MAMQLFRKNQGAPQEILREKEPTWCSDSLACAHACESKNGMEIVVVIDHDVEYGTEVFVCCISGIAKGVLASFSEFLKRFSNLQFTHFKS
jgi:hypothetical protein